MTDTTLVPADDRATYVKSRLVEINTAAGGMIYENGQLLREYKDNAYYKEDGFESFDAAIDAMQNAGTLDYGPRQARNFILIIVMFEALKLDKGDIARIGISKLRELATLKSGKDQAALLEAAPDMSVAEVQAAARKIRDVALGRDTDPLDPVKLMLTASQKEMYTECLTEARRIYALPETLPDAVVLTDSILAEWHTSRDEYEAREVEASL